MNTSNQLEQIANDIASWVPGIIASLIILIIGYLIALALKAASEAALKSLGINRKLSESPEGNIVRKITRDPSAFVGKVIFWVVFILIITFAILALDIQVLNQIIYSIYGYVPEIIASLIILIVAIALATGISSLTIKLIGDTPTGRVVSAVAPSLIMIIAIFMILVQLGIATPIVIITYIALIGAMSLGFALAFGLGGRDIAGQILEEAYRKSRENFQQARRDMEIAKSRGQQKFEQVKRRYSK